MNNFVSTIENQIWKSVDTETRIGVLDGLSGIALLYSYLTKITGDETYQSKLITIIDRINLLISEEEYDASFSSGIAGYGWILLKINNKNIAIDDEYFATIDNILAEALITNTADNYYDFLYGATGIAMYFIESYKVRKNKNIESVLIAFTNELLHKLDNDIDLLLTNTTEDPETKCHHFGLAHGVSGILNFLVHLKASVKDLIPNIDTSVMKIIDFMSRFKNYDAESKQYYPAELLLISRHISKPRLGWCQGDLGIGNAVYNSGLFLKNKTIQNAGIELINNTMSISVKESRVIDFGICHGSSGLALQYYLASQKSKDDYTEAIAIWQENSRKQTNDFVHFESFFINKYIPETNVLNGAAGMALVLLTLENSIDTDWLECLNLY